MKKLNVAIVGYGRSGCDIHGRFLRSAMNDICNVVAVVEYDPARAAAAKEHFGCETFGSHKDLYGRTDIDLVVSSTYSNEHYPVALDLLNHGFNVLSEKPLCKTPEQAQDLIDAAKKNNCVFTIFHQYRYNPYWQKMEEVINSGVLGDIKLVRARQNGFARRYDWQTLLYREGGSMRNNAAHPIEGCMHLAGSDELPEIYSRMELWNAKGDAEDYMFAVLKYKNGMTFELEFSPGDIYSDGVLFTVYGTNGTMKVMSNKVMVKYYKEEACPQPTLDHKSLHKPDGSPSYCVDPLQWHEDIYELGADRMNEFSSITSSYYHDLYNHMVNGGELFIKPEHIKAQIAIFNEIERQNPFTQTIERPAGI